MVAGRSAASPAHKARRQTPAARGAQVARRGDGLAERAGHDHSVGTITAGSVWCTTSRAQICVTMIIEANKLAAELSAARCGR